MGDTPIDGPDDEAAAAVAVAEPSDPGPPVLEGVESPDAKVIQMSDPEAQQVFDGRTVMTLLQQTRQALANEKVLYRLAKVGIHPDASHSRHPNQIVETIAELEKQLAIAIELTDELEASEVGIAGPSAIEIPSTAVVTEMNRAQRRAQGRRG